MDSFNSSDSEFDSEADEAECRLYTQLYFGEENCEELLPTESQEITRTLLKSPNYVDVANDASIGANRPNNSKSDNNIHNDKSDCGNFNSNFNTVVGDCSTVNNTDNVIRCDGASVQFDTPSKVSLENKKGTPLKGINVCSTVSRRRNISICSTDSISGKEPLDNLYCNYGHFEISSLNNCIRSSLDSILEINSSSNFEDSVCYSSEEESRYSIKSSKSKHLNKIQGKISKKVSDSGSSTEDEICILPPDSPKFVETLTLDSSTTSSSEESVQIVLNRPTPPVKKNCKRKNSVKTKRAKKKFNKVRPTSPIFLTSEDSEDSECEFLEATSSPMTSLTINVRQDKRNRSTTFTQNNVTTEKHASLSSFVKSQVIFSKLRPLTKREPSCLKWTIEMSSLYDSDISEDFDVESVHASQSDESKKWKIISEDYNVRPQNRYFNKQVRCFRCKEFGHHISKCPKIPHCLYCGSASHIHISQCPDNCCLRCGEGVHGYCHLTNNVMMCVLCNQAGHHAKLCPDIWRRFHATTKGGIPVKPKKDKKRIEKRIAYCYNCGKKGHYGHECGSNNYKKYSFVVSAAISYSPVDDVLDNLSYYRPGPNGQMSESCPDNEIENSLTGTTTIIQKRNYVDNRADENNQRIFRMKSSRTADIMSKIKYVKKEIRARSGASVLYTLRPTKKYWKIIISGNNRSVLEAEKIMNILLGKIPAYEYTQYNDLYSKVKDWHRNLPTEIASNMPANSLHMNQGTITPRHRFTPSKKSTPLHTSTPTIKYSGSIILKSGRKSLINSDGVIKTTPKSSKSKKISKKSLSPVMDDYSLLEFAKKRTSSKYGMTPKGKESLNNSFIQSKKNSVISPGHKKMFPFNDTIDKVFHDTTLLDSTPDARNKINELRKSRESQQVSKFSNNAPDIVSNNTSPSSKKKSKKSSGKGPVGGKALVKTKPDSRDIIEFRKEAKVIVDSFSKVVPNLNKFFVATSEAFETSKRKIKKTTKSTKIKVNCRMSLGKEKYVVNSNKSAISDVR